MLAVLATLLVLAALASLTVQKVAAPSGSETPSMASSAAVAATQRDDDLRLYDRVIERIAKGESYYAFIVAEQRARDYPVRPAVAIRLPTLAYLHAALGGTGMALAALVLALAVLLAWWRRLGEEPGGQEHRLLAMAFLAGGAALGLNRDFFVLHELWAGMLLALAFGLHRPGRWGASLAVAALALAIREHALPFALLLCTMAAWRRDWKEAAAWAALVLAFAAGLAWHIAQIHPQVLPSDPQGPGWLALRGLSGWLANVVLSSNLRLLPHELAGPLVVLALLGWSGWRSPAGTTGSLLYGGYALAFMLAGRANNYYWGAVIAPAFFIGLAFAPRTCISLLRAARGPK
ncbi:hypothetical protein J7348_04675 [Qipengyuania flava]|nr:hypothetical protein [Qipengyuania flava]